MSPRSIWQSSWRVDRRLRRMRKDIWSGSFLPLANCIRWIFWLIARQSRLLLERIRDVLEMMRTLDVLMKRSILFAGVVVPFTIN